MADDVIETIDFDDEGNESNRNDKNIIDIRRLAKHLDQIGMMLSETRSNAIEGRQNSGIEEEWTEDEEYYEGIDDANRRELSAWRGKPLGQALPLDEDKDSRGSTIFLNITRPYVDATAARMADMLLPTNDMSFKVGPTPKPDLFELSEGRVPPKVENAIRQNGQPLETQETQIAQAINAAKEVMVKANEAAKKVEKQIYDWHIESKYHAHNRRVIEDAAKVGSGVLKGPVPTKTSKMVHRGGKLKMVEEIKPASIRVFYRNFYPDPACGEDIHNGNYTFERDEITRSKLMRLEGVPGYITSQIRRVIKEGPTRASKEFSYSSDTPGLDTSEYAQKSLFEIWYYHGSMKLMDLMSIDIIADKVDLDDYKDKGPNEWVHVQVTMVNNRVIKATLSHLQTGEFPYDVMVWQRRMSTPFGIGIARQIRPAQRIVVGAIRHMMDNAGIAGGPMLYINTNIVQAADGINEVKPWKLYISADDYEPGQTSVREAIQFLQAPIQQKELQAIVELGMKMAEDVTGLPMIMQGQTSQQTPATLGGMQLQNNNASTVLRRVARLYDDLITEPHINRYYNHILQYSEDDELKGEFSVKALGSSALIERDLANQAIMQMGNMILNPVFGKDPKKWMDEMLKTNKLDPTRFNYEDEEWQQIVENMSQPEQDPKLEIEQMKIQAQQQMAQFKAQADGQLLQMRQQLADINNDKNRAIKMAELQMENEHSEKDRMMQLSLAQLDSEVQLIMANISEAGNDKRKIEDIKQKLQDTVMKLQTQISLSGTEALTPPVEPKGRAPEGESFQK